LVENAQQNVEYFVTTDLATVVDAVNTLKDARVIWCTGEYSGYSIAEFIAKQMTSGGLNALVFDPSMAGTATALTRMVAGDVLLTFAGNEPSIDAGYAVRLAKDMGIKTVTISGSGVALPARIADVSIIVPHKSPAGVASFGPMMEVVSLIWEALMTPGTDETKARVQAHQERMGDLLKLRSETPEYEVAGPQNIWQDNVRQG